MEIDAIKKKVLEDVDPETRRKKKKEMRIQRLIVTLQFLGIAAVVILIFYILMGISTGMITASIDSRLDPFKFHTIDLLRTDHMHMRCPGKCPVIRIFLNIVMIAGNHDHLRMFQHLQYGIHFF